MKRKTIGLDPKVPVQGISTAVLFVAGYYGVDLDAEVAGAIAVVLGALIGSRAPAPQVTTEVKDVVPSSS